jgi:hypothetical protein
MRAADVVIGARRRLDGHEHEIGAHRIAHVGDGTQGFEVAHLDHGLHLLRLDHRDLLGEARLGEDVAAARSGMREHARGHHGHAVGFGIEPADQVGTDLGDRVRRRRMERALLVDRQLVPRDAAEHFRRCADMHDGLRAGRADRLEHARRALDVGVVGVERRLEAGAREALGGKMEDVVGPRLAHDVLHRQRVAQVAVEKEHAVAPVDPVRERLEIVQRTAPPDHPVDVPVRVGDQVLGQVRPDHSRDARDQCALACHDLRLRPAPSRP